uniref:Uncharacterized protein n=1 Tax=Anguilla anguilla TaxID=7936 RepID=A0A0E9P9G0_ANGAN
MWFKVYFDQNFNLLPLHCYYLYLSFHS